MTFELGTYLERLGHAAAPCSPDALRDLQAAHLRAIPFENLDPLLGTVPDLDPAALWRKLVLDGRGGYCLELNGLFGAALGALGYDATPFLGRVRMGASEGGARTHLAHVVRFGDAAYLVDVGFGGPAPERPLRIGVTTPQEDRLGTFRLRLDAAAGETVLDRETPDGWFALYGFDRVPVTQADRVAANFYCAAHPNSPFPNHLMLNRVTAEGRASMFDLHVTTPRKDWSVASAAELAGVLEEWFGLEGEVEARRLWTRLRPPSAA